MGAYRIKRVHLGASVHQKVQQIDVELLAPRHQRDGRLPCPEPRVDVAATLDENASKSHIGLHQRSPIALR